MHMYFKVGQTWNRQPDKTWYPDKVSKLFVYSMYAIQQPSCLLKYCGWLNFRGVPIFMVFVEGPIHKFQYPQNFQYELWRKILWLRILNPMNVSFSFNPRKLVPTKIKPSTVHLALTVKWKIQIDGQIDFCIKMKVSSEWNVNDYYVMLNWRSLHSTQYFFRWKLLWNSHSYYAFLAQFFWNT